MLSCFNNTVVRLVSPWRGLAATALSVALLATSTARGGAPLQRAARPLTDAARHQLTPIDPLEGGVAWLNTEKPLTPTDLRGRVVLLDFWTLC